MVVVFLKNGEKAPMPDAAYVKVEAAAAGGQTLRCFWGDQEVGVFKWDEVAGYTIAAVSSHDSSSAAPSLDAWQARLNPEKRGRKVVQTGALPQTPDSVYVELPPLNPEARLVGRAPRPDPPAHKQHGSAFTLPG
jgi:hypothetical protein